MLAATRAPLTLPVCVLLPAARGRPAQLQALLGSSHRVWNWGHVAATMQSSTNCARGGLGRRICGQNR